jgi:hypothetical protein
MLPLHASTVPARPDANATIRMLSEGKKKRAQKAVAMSEYHARYITKP